MGMSPSSSSAPCGHRWRSPSRSRASAPPRARSWPPHPSPPISAPAGSASSSTPESEPCASTCCGSAASRSPACPLVVNRALAAIDARMSPLADRRSARALASWRLPCARETPRKTPLHLATERNHMAASITRRGALSLIGTAALWFTGLTALPGCSGKNAAAVTVGSKSFTEGVILFQLYAPRARGRRHPRRAHLQVLGLSHPHRARRGRHGPSTPEYTGTGLISVLQMEPITDPDQVYDTVKDEYAKQFDLVWLAKSEAADGQGLVIRTEAAKKFGIETISSPSRPTRASCAWPAGPVRRAVRRAARARGDLRPLRLGGARGLRRGPEVPGPRERPGRRHARLHHRGPAHERRLHPA